MNILVMDKGEITMMSTSAASPYVDTDQTNSKAWETSVYVVTVL